MARHSILLPAIAALLTGAAPDNGAPADPATPTILAAERERDLRMSVPVSIAGRGPYRFLVDTGAQSTVLSRQLLSELELAPDGGATLVGLASVQKVETVELDGLSFAGREINGLVAPLLEASHIGADGIIGLDSLQGLRVTIDLRSDTLSVASAADSEGNRGYEIIVRARAKKGQMIITRAELDGVRTAVIIDTGSQASFGNKALQRALRARAHAELTSRDVNGAEVRSTLGYANRLTIDRFSMNDIPIGFAESPVFGALGLSDSPALILGMRNLRLFDRVAIDFGKRRVLFDLPRETRTEL